MVQDADRENSERAVRALMRRGLSDDAIAKLTGLDLLQLLEMRAAAAVEERGGGPHVRPGDVRLI